MSRSAVGRSEFVWKSFRAHAIYGAGKVAVSDGGTTGLNRPEWLAQGPHSCRGVKNNFRPV